MQIWLHHSNFDDHFSQIQKTKMIDLSIMEQCQFLFVFQMLFQEICSNNESNKRVVCAPTVISLLSNNVDG